MPRKPPRSTEERLVRAQKSMMPGTLGGRVASAAPMALDVTRLDPRLRANPNPDVAVPTTPPFAWADRIGITLQSNPDSAVTGTSHFAFVIASMDTDSVVTHTSLDNDWFSWSSSSAHELLIKTDGFYVFTTLASFSPDAGASMEFYSQPYLPSNPHDFRLTVPRDASPGAFQPVSTESQDVSLSGRAVQQTVIVRGGVVFPFFLDAYYGPATGSAGSVTLSVFKITP